MNNYEHFLAQEAKINKKIDRINNSIEHNGKVDTRHEQFILDVNNNTFHEQMRLFMSDIDNNTFHEQMRLFVE